MFNCGDLIDQYRIIQEIGSGSYGTVYAVENTVSGQKFAMKVIPLQGPGAYRELEAVKRYRNIRHPNLIQIHHVGTANDLLYYTMDWATDSFRTKRPTPAELKAAVEKLLDALALLHSSGLIHRDIKPDNILWMNGEPVLGDIGLVSGMESVSMAGSPGFMPPAVWRGISMPDEYADLYALAKVVYCMLSGKKAGDYPNYDGPCDPISALLFNAVLSVCDEKAPIKTIAGFKSQLERKPLLQDKYATAKRWFLYPIAAILCCIVAGLVCWRLSMPPESSKSVSMPKEKPLQVWRMIKQPEGHVFAVNSSGHFVQCATYRELRRKWQILKNEKNKFADQIKIFTRLLEKSGSSEGRTSSDIVKKQDGNTVSVVQYFELEHKLTELEKKFGFKLSVITSSPDPKVEELFREIEILYQQQLKLLRCI